MKARLSTAAVLIGLMLVSLSGAAAQSTATRRSTVTKPFITGSFLDASNGQGVFSGNLKLAPFEIEGGKVVAVGRLTGQLADSTGEAVGRVDQQVTWPVESVSGTCDALQLKFASVELTLQNVDVRVEPLELDITAGARRTDRTRELICSVATLAKSDAAAGDLTSKLNDLFQALR